MKRDIVFVSKFNTVKLEKKSDIILSPEFYWVIKRKLPVKSIGEAKKLCDSLFDGTLPDGRYSFKVLKKGELFYIFAYDSDFIISSLKSIGADISKIANIYLAQNELLSDVSYSLGSRAYISQDGIFISLPISLVSNETKDIADLQFSKLSNTKISLERYDTVIDKRSLNIIMILIMVFVTLSLSELFLYKKEFDTISKAKDSLYETYHLPKTSWQINAIKDKIERVHKTQVDFRDSLYKILKTPLAKGSFIKNLEITKERISVDIKIANDLEADKIKDALLKSFEIDRAIVKSSTMSLELRYAKN